MQLEKAFFGRLFPFSPRFLRSAGTTIQNALVQPCAQRSDPGEPCPRDILDDNAA
jgi:hypothetical protein